MLNVEGKQGPGTWEVENLEEREILGEQEKTNRLGLESLGSHGGPETRL